MPSFGLLRVWNGSQAAHGPSRVARWMRRFALPTGILVGLLSAGGAIAYYTAAETQAPSQPGPSASKWRYADATDAWLEALRTPEFWNKVRSRSRTSDEGRSSRRARRSSSESTRSHRNRESRSSNRASTREQTIIREHPTRVIRESTESQHRATHTPPVLRGGESIRYYSFVPKEISTYRTMCVRLCDGYYWPVSSSATRREFTRDNEVCQRSCESPAALYVYRNFGEEAENMVDLQGHPYIGLDTAFMYRATYNEACKCRPHPWEEASRQRHLSYQTAGQAEAAAVGKP